jgi:nitrogenase molybdenum-iron protein alpha chain
MTTDKTVEKTEEFREEVLEKYPAKVARKRGKAFVVNDPGAEPAQAIQANVRTIPGIITQRGCCYAGCKGVVLGPSRDIINITHGPIGCGFYSWLTRRNQTRPESAEHANFMTYCFSTDMQDENIVFGGEKKLRQAIREAIENFNPRQIGVFSTCPVGLIGDDVHAVCREMEEEFPDVNIFGFSCEGYRGVSQSAGHHIANNQIFKHAIGLNDTPDEGKFRINMLGEYNIGGDAFIIEALLEKCGITLTATFSGNSTVESFEKAHTVDLNCVMCHRSINYVADMMETKYGIPWIKVNFIGADATAKSLRKIAEYFEDEELMARVEEVITEEMAPVLEAQNIYRPRNEGKKAAIFVGGSRAHHYQNLFAEMGITTVAAGYEFAHRDDYEGRKVLPNIKVDADSRNIEELHVEADPKLYKPRKDKEAMEAKGYQFSEYEGMMPEMPKGTMAIDDISHWESEMLVMEKKVDIFCAGIKEKYVIQKMGVPMKQLHSYDYGGPFAAFKGAINFYKEIDRALNTEIWQKVTPPWKDKPAITAGFGSG